MNFKGQHFMDDRNTAGNSKQAQKRLDLTAYLPLLRLLANR